MEIANFLLLDFENYEGLKRLAIVFDTNYTIFEFVIPLFALLTSSPVQNIFGILLYSRICDSS